MTLKHEFTHRKIYPNGDIVYTKFNYPIVKNKQQTNEEKYRDFQIRIQKYKEQSKGQKDGTFQELIENDWYYQEMEDEKNRPINERIGRSKRRVRMMVKDYAICNDFTWFLTLTDKDQLHDRDQFSRRVRSWARMLRQRHYKDLKFLIILEQHKSGAWHAHALMNDVISKDMVYAQMRKGNQSFNFAKWRFGFSVAERIEDKMRLSSYITKYITLALFVEKNKQAYFVSEGLNLPIKEEGAYTVQIIDSDRYYERHDFKTYYQDNQISKKKVKLSNSLNKKV